MIYFTQKEICGLTGLRPRQVQGLVEEGVITPGVAESKAPGGVRKYSSVNLIDFAISAELLRIHIPRETIRKIIKESEIVKYIKPSSLGGYTALYIYENLGGEIVVHPGVQWHDEELFFEILDRDGTFVPDRGSLINKKIIKEIKFSVWTLIIRVSRIVKKVEKYINWDEVESYADSMYEK